jgi:hypothetical protein
VRKVREDKIPAITKHPGHLPENPGPFWNIVQRLAGGNDIRLLIGELQPGRVSGELLNKARNGCFVRILVRSQDRAASVLSLPNPF